MAARIEIIRKPVQHKLSLAARDHKAGAAQMLEVLRGVGDGEPAARGQRLDAAVALRHEFEKLKAMLVRDRLGHDCKLRVKRALGIGA